jgi:uncharacterized protein DUF3987
MSGPTAPSSSTTEGSGSPILSAEDDLIRAFSPGIEDARVRRSILDRYAEKLANDAAKTGDPLAIEEAQNAAKKAQTVNVPPAPRLVMGDSSPEKLISLLGQHGRIAAISAEAGILASLQGSRHAKASNMDPLLKSHAGDRLDNETIARGAERADNPALTLVMSIQPYALNGITQAGGEAAARGLAARPLWSITPDIVGTRKWDDSKAVAQETLVGYHALIRDIALYMAIRPDAITATFDEPALKVFGEYHDRVEEMMRPGGEFGAGLIREWLGKLVGAVARIAAALHVATSPPPELQRRQDGFIDPLAQLPEWDIGIIGETTVRGAIQLGEYFRAHATAALGGSEDGRAPLARQLLSWLIHHKMTDFALRNVQRTGPRPLRQIETLNRAVAYLTALGWIQASESSSYLVHPDAETLATAATAATGDEVYAGEGHAR